MEKDVLVILMVAFGLFAIVMFILFFVYLKKYYNNRHLNDDYRKEIDDEDDLVEPVVPPQVEVKEVKQDINEDMEFVPIKKK